MGPRVSEREDASSRACLMDFCFAHRRNARPRALNAIRGGGKLRQGLQALELCGI